MIFEAADNSAGVSLLQYQSRLIRQGLLLSLKKLVFSVGTQRLLYELAQIVQKAYTCAFNRILDSVATARTKKHDQILSSARELFWKHGFRRISIEEICDHAAVSKMTFYKFFPNKIELAKAVFEREADLGVQRFRDILQDDSTSRDKINKIVRMKLDSTQDISREFLNDFYGNPELGLKQYIEEKTKQCWRHILQDFRDAQFRGVFRRDFNPEFLLMLSQKFAEMVTDDKLLQLYNSPQDLVMELTNFVTYGISAGLVEETPSSSRKKNI